MIEYRDDILYVVAGDTTYQFSLTLSGHWYFERARDSLGREVLVSEPVSLPAILTAVERPFAAGREKRFMLEDVAQADAFAAGVSEGRRGWHVAALDGNTVHLMSGVAPDAGA